MKIAWFCIPAHGHTNPTLALVKELTDAGHQVYYFSFEAFREKIERAGAVFIGCDSYEFEMEDGGNADRVGKDLAYSTELMVSSTLALDGMAAEKVKEIQPDLIVSDSVAHWGKLTAMKYKIPFVSSTTTFAFNQHSSRYMKQSLGELFKMLFSMPKINKQLRRLQDKGYPVKSILEIVQNDNDTNTIVYTSKHFQPCADTFSDKYRFIGPSIRPIETPMEKTAEKTIYISMGTVVKNEAFYRNCVEAFRDTPYQVILSLGTNEVGLGELPPNIQVYDSVDQMAVLDIADVFITHCGMNSASEGLYYEVPLVLVPQTPEQGAVAMRTEELGAGIRLTDQQPAGIRRAAEQLMQEPQYRDAAKQISQSFKACGGTALAREFLESLAKKGATL
ncbi:MAG: glucosyltransferase [Oscillospiraceae bacterium]|nr:glucosyltransferase [Oscillospiraceae bacterium]